MEHSSALARVSSLPGGEELSRVVSLLPHLDGPALGRLALVRAQPDPPDELELLREEIISPELPFVADLLDLHALADTLTCSSLALESLRRSWLGLLPCSEDRALSLAAAAVRDALTGALAEAFLDRSRRGLLMDPWWALAS